MYGIGYSFLEGSFGEVGCGFTSLIWRAGILIPYSAGGNYVLFIEKKVGC